MITTTLDTSLKRLGIQTDRNPVSHTPPVSQARVAVAGVSQQLHAAAYSETFQLEITTREGDQVQVNVRQMLAGLQARETVFAGYAGSEGVAVVASHAELAAGAFEARFGLYVQGDLNEAEMVALQSIFKQVGRLADEFFNGDIQGALAAAQQLRADPDQIAGLNLDITQRYVQMQASRQAAAAYVEVARDTDNTPWPPRAGQQVTRYWAQVEQVQATIRETFRSFSLSIEFMMAGGDQKKMSAIEQVHEQIAEAVGELRSLLGLDEAQENLAEEEAVESGDHKKASTGEVQFADQPAQKATSEVSESAFARQQTQVKQPAE